MAGLTPDEVTALAPAQHFGGRSLLGTVAAVESTSAALQAEGATAAAVGAAAGYRSPSAFCAAWRRLTGFTPRAWARADEQTRRGVVAALISSGRIAKDTDRGDRVGTGLA